MTLTLVMPGLVPNTHALLAAPDTWMAGTIPGSSPGTAMTGEAKRRTTRSLVMPGPMLDEPGNDNESIRRGGHLGDRKR
jgi:hypothetical protein